MSEDNVNKANITPEDQIMPQDFLDACEKELGPDSCELRRPGIMHKRIAIPVFYADPGAAELQTKIDAFSNDFFNSFYDPTHPFHKSITTNEKFKYFEKIIANQELRMKFGWSRHCYYNPSEQPISQTVQVIQQGFAGEQVPIYEPPK